MLIFTGETLWFFLPMLIANQFPGFAAILNLPGNFPINKKLFGPNKTWAAYYTAIIGSISTLYLQKNFSRSSIFDYERPDLWLVGVSIGIGVVVGDHVKSFIKRRLGIAPGERWWPFDQLDFFAGGLIAVTPFTGWIGWGRVLIIILLILIIHPLGNQLGYRLGLRKNPW